MKDSDEFFNLVKCHYEGGESAESIFVSLRASDVGRLNYTTTRLATRGRVISKSMFWYELTTVITSCRPLSVPCYTDKKYNIDELIEMPLHIETIDAQEPNPEESYGVGDFDPEHAKYITVRLSKEDALYIHRLLLDLKSKFVILESFNEFREARHDAKTVAYESLRAESRNFSLINENPLFVHEISIKLTINPSSLDTGKYFIVEQMDISLEHISEIGMFGVVG